MPFEEDELMFRMQGRPGRPPAAIAAASQPSTQLSSQQSKKTATGNIHNLAEIRTDNIDFE